MIKIGINGFGRIGRLVFRAICDQGLLGKQIDVVAVNDLVPADNLAYLVKYDSTQGRAREEVSSKKSSAAVAEDDVLVVDGHEIKCLAVKEGPAAIPWKDL
ncbi:MAG TPA: glyceraldehyde 3-phosphate dehydrogenase NAD-binding domain-containing protein, partial [Verrucomicrobiales bacterium]|nr:glyceraldehyde 3-phosphate dehydrogenase NAD-binding domain-containing protein [Verrucomicrobiales bacterium]HWB04447.1 glyceraldehyde 3-phosphate dehydrogenase NAD-binding domain-containing protein [Verrucomicrobiales bacterium]